LYLQRIDNFFKVPIPDGNIPLVGEIIEIEQPQESKNKLIFGKGSFLTRNLSGKKWLSVAAAFMIFIISMLYTQIGVNTAAAYVNLDMKPSVQLTVDKNGYIQDAIGLNTEGKNLTKSISVNDNDIYTGVQKIIRRANSLGYLTPSQSEENILVMTSVVQLKNTSKPLINEQQLKSLIDQELVSNGMSGYIVMNGASKEQWQQAKNSGYTINEYMFIEHAKENGIDIQHDQFNNEHHITEYIKNANVPVERMFPNNSYRVNWKSDNYNSEKIDQEYINQKDNMKPHQTKPNKTNPTTKPHIEDRDRSPYPQNNGMHKWNNSQYKDREWNRKTNWYNN